MSGTNNKQRSANVATCLSPQHFSDRRFCSSAIKMCFSCQCNNDIGLRCNSIFSLRRDQAGLAGALQLSCISEARKRSRFKCGAARDACSEYNMVNDTKAVMSDTQKSPGKTLLWTQQQHYT